MDISGVSTESLWDYVYGATLSTGEAASSALVQGGAGAEVFAAASAMVKEPQVQESDSDSSSTSSGSFDPLDTNQDGHVSVEELENALQLQRASQVTQTRLASGDARAEVGNAAEEQARGREIYRGAGLASPGVGADDAGPGSARGMELSV